MVVCKNLVVKIGGSIITEKEKKYSIREEVIEEVAEAIAEYTRKGGRIALVHGGGSFGHQEVISIHAEKGLLETPDSARVQLAMLKLSVRILDKLVARGVPAILHPPHSLCRNGKANQCKFSIIMKDYDLHLVPVTYGDAIPTEDGVKIISGDDLAAALASLLSSDCLIYVIDKEGVLDEKGERIPMITSEDDVKLEKTEKYDVTGGIRHKINVALNLARTYRGSIIITDLNGFKKLLEGQASPEEVGTVVKGKGEEA